MAMLAEPRQRKRYNLTPRGKALYEDDSRFGTKMLEKMGWSKGKGLGANEDGIQDFVRVRMRNNNEGLGFQDRDDHWTQHEQDFSGLLKTLNGKNENDGENSVNKNEENASDDEPSRVGFGFAAEPKKPKLVKLKDKISGISLEEKSKMSKARVHYRKFTKGKDIAQYSEKDLANIFGKKVVESEQANGIYAQLTAITSYPQEEKEEEKPTKVDKEEKEIKPNFAGVQTVSTGLSVSDYFKQKMEALKNKQKQHNKNESFEKENDQTDVGDVEDIESKKKSKKRKRQEMEEEEEEQVGSGDVNKTEDGTVVEVQSKKKEKRKKVNLEADVLELPNAEEIAAPESVIETKKENKKKKRDACETVVDLMQETANVEVPKKKKKKSKEERCQQPIDGIDVDSADQKEENVDTEQVAENLITEQPKKAKKSKKMVEEAQEVEAELLTNQVPKMMKKKKDKKILEVDETTLSPEIPADVLCTVHVATKKKKKSKNKEKLENGNKDVIELSEVGTVSEAVEVGKHTKLKKQKKYEEDVSEEIDKLNLDELKAKCNSYNIYTISSFCAEKFRNVDIDLFQGANLSDLPGYSYNGTDLQLNIQYLPGDEKRITELWNCTINKYNLANPKAIFYKYSRNMIQAFRAKQKLPHLHMKRFKRKSIFQAI